MIKNERQLKDKIKIFSKGEGIKFQSYLKLFFIERLLQRISQSKYKDKIIIKGGVLMISIFGAEERLTKDIDSTIQNILFTKENLEKVFTEIINIDLKDRVQIEIIGFKENMLNKFQSGFELTLKFVFDKIRDIISFDLSRGDWIIPEEINKKYKTFLGDEEFELFFFPIESVIGEKFHAILDGDLHNTRMKDFYDMHFVSKLESHNFQIINDACEKIFEKHNSKELLEEGKEILEDQLKSKTLLQRWNSYKQKSVFVPSTLEWEEVMKEITDFYNKIFPE